MALTSQSKGAQPPPDASFCDLYNATKEADRLSNNLMGMVDELADARMIIEYDGERRKAALSRAVLIAFKGGADSSARAEHEARASVRFEEDLRELSKAYAQADKSRLIFENTKIRLDVLRTIISAEKSKMEL